MPAEEPNALILGDPTMNRPSLKKTLVFALVAIGGLSAIGASTAEAGWYRRCYTPSYSYCNTTVYSPATTYCSPSYFRTYSYAPVRSYNYNYNYSSWCAPTLHSPVTISPYSYGGFSGYSYSGYNCYPSYGYGGYGGYGGCGYATPVSYGQCGW